MPIKQTKPQSAIDRAIMKRVVRIRQAAIYALSYVGEQVRNEAIARGSYTDRTGNLRNSVGYVIAIDGRAYKVGDFGKGTKTVSAEGKAIGKTLAMQLVAQYPQGIVLIVVAGMNYARYVAAKGYDVLDSAELLAKKLVPTMLKQLGL